MRPASASQPSCRHRSACGTYAIALPRFGIFRKTPSAAYEAPSVIRPALQNRQIQKTEFIPLDDFLARAAGSDLGKEGTDIGQHRQHLQLIQPALAASAFSGSRKCLATSFHAIHAQRHSIRFMLAKALISTGMSNPSLFQTTKPGRSV